MIENIIYIEFDKIFCIFDSIYNFNDYKDFKVFMIEIYLNRIFNIFEIMISIFHEFNDNKYFLIIDIIIIFNE